MSKDNNKNVYKVTGENEPFAAAELMELGVTEEEVTAAERLMASLAEKSNDEVDYSGMLRRIKASAMEQGLASELAKSAAGNKEARRRRLARILRIAATAAAAFVVGLGVFGVVKAMNAAKTDPDDTPKGDISAVNQTAVPARTQAADATAVPDTTYSTNRTESTNTPVEATETPDFTEQAPEANDTPLPTEFAIRGGTRGYTYIKGFETPVTSQELIPPAMPSFMEVKPYEEGLGYAAYGKREDGTACEIECKVTEAGEDDLPEGAALYTLHNDGRGGYVWRINENSCMYIEFVGFDYSEAESLLLSYNMPELAEE